jgi:hypothetical protein
MGEDSGVVQSLSQLNGGDLVPVQSFDTVSVTHQELGVCDSVLANGPVKGRIPAVQRFFVWFTLQDAQQNLRRGLADGEKQWGQRPVIHHVHISSIIK